MSCTAEVGHGMGWIGRRRGGLYSVKVSSRGRMAGDFVLFVLFNVGK